MRYKLLGRSGLRVSEICLGTMTFGDDWGWGSPRDEARKIYGAFLDAGGNFLDTANIYTNGTSETLLGDFMQGHRERVVLATKYTNATAVGVDPNSGGNQRKNMVQACEASLKRLRTDYIDLYWMHIWDQVTPVEEVMRGFDDLVRQGKVLYCGISDAPAWWVARANTLAELRGWSPFVALQIEWSLIERSVERELVPMARALGLAITPWSPLAGGVLTGKYAGGGSSEPRRYDAQMGSEMRARGERVDRIVAAVQRVAQQCGRSTAQVALSWLLRQSASQCAVIPIIGARRTAQLEDNLAAATLTLTTEQAATLDEASAIEPGFPERFFGMDLVRNFVYAGFRDRLDA